MELKQILGVYFVFSGFVWMLHLGIRFDKKTKGIYIGDIIFGILAFPIWIPIFVWIGIVNLCKIKIKD